MNLRLILLACPLVAAGLLSTAPAWAQSSTEQRMQQGPIVSGTGQRRPASRPSPPGLPGAAVGGDRVAPADRAAADMPPTEALFDSINRGDIVSARDALARGADFTAHNVLGLTPLDESIDLGRNDITFLLLSLRGAAPSAQGPVSASAGAGAKAGAKPSPAATKDAAKEAARKPAAPAPAPRAVVQQAPPRPVAQAVPPRQTGGGTPNPQSGFLGFGG